MKKTAIVLKTVVTFLSVFMLITIAISLSKDLEHKKHTTQTEEKTEEKVENRETNTLHKPKSPEGFTTVWISPERQQIIGIKTDEVTTRRLVRDIRTVGIVEADETKIARVSVKFSGWVKEVFANYVGKYVKRGEPLFTIYSPELVSTQEEYLLALKAHDSFGKSSFPEISSSARSLLEATRRRLLLWDIPEREIKKVENTGKPLKYLTLYSPISGYVTKREAFPEKMIMPNEVIFEIVDLSTVWVLADIYEYELPLIKEGQEATLTLSYYPGEVFHGKVTYIYPTLETKTRTAKVRFEFKNEDNKLKPGMYANVELKIPLGEKLAISEDSVIDTGERKIVFVAMEDGTFEPREVKVGQKAGQYYEILKGLKEGETVVRSANFLVDSESRLRAAIEAFGTGTHGHAHGGSETVSETPKEVNISFTPEGESPKVGDNTFKITLTDKDRNPIKDAKVDVLLHMPPMPSMGMPAMSVSAEGRHVKDGLYIAEVNIPMGGSWQVRVTVQRPGKTPVSRFFEINVR
jgi:multidrug efflux pump subunit AcrA (membrane-fusion protein)